MLLTKKPTIRGDNDLENSSFKIRILIFNVHIVALVLYLFSVL